MPVLKKAFSGGIWRWERVSILIVDPSHSFANLLRAKLVTYGLSAHIFASYKAALMVLESKKIDSVVVPFDAAQETIEFCEVVRTLGVPLVYVTGNQANTRGTHASGWHPHF